MKLHIVSLHPLKPALRNAVEAAAPDAVLQTAKADECAPLLADADILLAFGQTNLAPLLPLAPKLRWIQALTAGVDGFLALDAFRTSDILLTNVRGIHGIPIAEHVLGMMLAANRGLLAAHDQKTRREWKTLRGLDEIYGKTAAVVGFGSVGRAVAKRLKAMGLYVLGVKQSKTDEPDADELFLSDRLYDILPRADFVIVSLPLTPETKGIFNRDAFARMKPSAFFINIARGPVVCEADLADALTRGVIGGAGLDVFCEEPLPDGSPLWDAPRLLITPHQAASSPRYMERAVGVFIENLKAFPDTARMINLIDKRRGY